jgi:prepilin-type N-terminal cleavage/methylation domain-containing protein
LRSTKAAGFTLVEVVIATLLLAVGVAGVFSVTLSARQQGKRHAGRDKINQYGRQLQEELKSYVTYTHSDTPNLPATSRGLPRGQKKHPDDTCGEWALSTTCAHDVTSMLPEDLKRAPYNAKLTYTVKMEGLVRRVNIQMKWDDP